MATVLITGANRGIGLALARCLVQRGDTVIGTARDPARAEALRSLGARVEALDGDDPASVSALGERLRGTPVRWVINNAGVYPDKGMGFDTITPEALLQAYRTNCVAPVLVTRSLLPSLSAAGGGLVVHVSSTMGSIGQAAGHAKDSLAYRSSKAALNMLTVLMANDLKGRGVTVVAQHPGWVKTDMGGAGAHLEADDSARRMLAVWDRLTIADSGRYLDLDGGSLPW